MQSKLTLRIDDEVKGEAKELAQERGTSLSQMVEDYFRVLLASGSGTGSPLESPEERPPSESLGPVTRRIAGALQSEEAGPPLHGETKDDDRRRAYEAAAEKHA